MQVISRSGVAVDFTALTGWGSFARLVTPVRTADGWMATEVMCNGAGSYCLCGTVPHVPDSGRIGGHVQTDWVTADAMRALLAAAGA